MFLFNLSDIYQTAANEVGSGSSFPSFKMYFSKLQNVCGIFLSINIKVGLLKT